MGAANKQQANARLTHPFDRLVNAVVRPQASDGGRVSASRVTATALARSGLLSLYS